MRFADIATSVEGKRFYLTVDGMIVAREVPNTFEYQHLPPHKRPEWTYKAIPGPDGVTVKRITAGQLFDLECIGSDGLIYRRTRDLKSMTGERWHWQQVEISL